MSVRSVNHKWRSNNELFRNHGYSKAVNGYYDSVAPFPLYKALRELFLQLIVSPLRNNCGPLVLVIH